MITYLIKLYEGIEVQTINPLHDKPNFVVLEDGRKVVDAAFTSDPNVVEGATGAGYIVETESIYIEAFNLLNESNYLLWITEDAINGTPLSNADIVDEFNHGNLKGYEFIYVVYYNNNGSIGFDTLLVMNGVANLSGGGAADYDKAIKIVGSR